MHPCWQKLTTVAYLIGSQQLSLYPGVLAQANSLCERLVHEQRHERARSASLFRIPTIPSHISSVEPVVSKIRIDTLFYENQRVALEGRASLRVDFIGSWLELTLPSQSLTVASR